MAHGHEKRRLPVSRIGTRRVIDISDLGCPRIALLYDHEVTEMQRANGSLSESSFQSVKPCPAEPLSGSERSTGTTRRKGATFA